jgi:hypothetical protein
LINVILEIRNKNKEKINNNNNNNNKSLETEIETEFTTRLFKSVAKLVAMDKEINFKLVTKLVAKMSH